jgi:hypothetical protein
VTTRWRIPSSAIAVAAFFALVALPRPAIPLIDGDVFWHIRAGEEILDTGSVPRVDTWSIVGEGKEWTSQDWLSNVVLAAGYRLGEIGPTLLSLVWALLVVVALAVLWSAIGRRNPRTGWLSRIIWLGAGLTVAGPTLGVRVQVVDLLLSAGTIWVLWTFMAHRRPAVLLILPVLAVAFANLHAGWPLLFILGGAVLVGEAADRLLRRRLDTEPLALPQLGWLLLALVAAAAVIPLNPNGIDLYRYPIETSSIAAHRDFISEWQPPDPGTFIGQVLIGFVIVGVIPTILLAWRRMRLADALILVGLILMAANAARFLLVAGPIPAAIITLYLAPNISRSRFGQRFAPFLARMATPRRSPVFSTINLVLVALMVLVGLGVTAARISPAEQTRATAEHMPVSAVDWILANDPGQRPFNQYSWGGYLGLRRPDAPIFIDGRSDVYGNDPIQEYASVVRANTDPGPFLDRYEINYVLFPSTGQFAQRMDASSGWQRVYTDPIAAVWVRDDGR